MNGVPTQDAVLDDATVARLELIGVVLRPLGMRRATGGAATLADASRALADRSASIQLRYRHAGEEWWDTLIPLPAGVRLATSQLRTGHCTRA
jgi:hypothetical protein